MGDTNLFARSVVTVLTATAPLLACGDVPIDDERRDARVVPPRGVIRGTVTYVGPRPCSRSGHVVGSALMLLFDRRNPPPPDGIAMDALNFVAVPGDVLFANEPRAEGDVLYCPPRGEPIVASAPFTIAPLEGGSYQISAFYDRRGRFLPTFKFRNLPEAGDVGGGYVDLARKQSGIREYGYQPPYLPINVGVPQSSGSVSEIPEFVIERSGFVVDNVPVTIASTFSFTRPYFYPEGAEKTGVPATSPVDPGGIPQVAPFVVMAEDAKLLAPPGNATPSNLAAYQASFVSIKLIWGVARGEWDTARSQKSDAPFGLQLPALPLEANDATGGLSVFLRNSKLPDNPALPELWPQVVLVKLADDPAGRKDVQSLVAQGSAAEEGVTGKARRPLVVLSGITLLDDSLGATIAGPVPGTATPASLRNHLTVLLRPAVLCFDPSRVSSGGVLVTPHFTGQSADAEERGERALFDLVGVKKQPRVSAIVRGCLPKGRYAISLVYPTGQAWTVPNELGSCAASEGPTVLMEGKPMCVSKPRPVLPSQGARGVLEIVGASDPATCAAHPVPDVCTRL